MLSHSPSSFPLSFTSHHAHPEAESSHPNTSTLAQRHELWPAMANAAAARSNLQPNMPGRILQLLGPVGSCWASCEVHGGGCMPRVLLSTAAPGAFEGAWHSQGTTSAGSLSPGRELSLLVLHGARCGCSPLRVMPAVPRQFRPCWEGDAEHSPPCVLTPRAPASAPWSRDGPMDQAQGLVPSSLTGEPQQKLLWVCCACGLGCIFQISHRSP